MLIQMFVYIPKLCVLLLECMRRNNGRASGSVVSVWLEGLTLGLDFFCSTRHDLSCGVVKLYRVKCFVKYLFAEVQDCLSSELWEEVSLYLLQKEMLILNLHNFVCAADLVIFDVPQKADDDDDDCVAHRLFC